VRAPCPQEKNNSPTVEHGTARERTEGSVITLRTLQNALRSFCEELSADIKTQIGTLHGELQDINNLRGELSSQMKTLTDNQSESINKQREMEKSLTDVGDRVVALEKANERLSNDYKKALEKCMDLENRSRRQNIRIVGVDEDSEKSNPTRFVVDLVMQILGRENFRSPLIIDRAHRTLGPKPGPGERPRALLVRLHYYTGKEKILQLSREKGQLLYNGSPVHIFPDTSPEVTRLRASFKHVKAKLRTSDVPYSLFYPAKLLITAKGSRYVFTDPQEAEKFVAEITTA
uniref:L1 transposable element RRM domain-containing protein n=1 Tax=Salarias fasciatus TaxID=181472 RepID=A0A672I005_SALFA